MKYLDEYRDGDRVKAQLQVLHRIVSRPWQVMEICGGQTHNFLKSGLDGLLPDKITLFRMPILAQCSTPEDVRRGVHAMLDAFGDTSRLIVSCGGGMPPGVPTDNIRAFIAAVAERG